jgi:hypothetical protein
MNSVTNHEFRPNAEGIGGFGGGCTLHTVENDKQVSTELCPNSEGWDAGTRLDLMRFFHSRMLHPSLARVEASMRVIQ